jgi:hypothetical protein
MATFLVVLLRSGPRWDPSRPLEEQSDWPEHASFMDELVGSGFVVLGGPLADEHRVALAVEAESEDVVRATLARDPWSDTHLRVGTIDPWTIRLDGRGARQRSARLRPNPAIKEDDMPEYARVVTFEADEAALDALLNEIKSADGPPEGVPAKRITVLADRSAGRVVVAVRFGSEEDLRTGGATLEAMSPPAVGNMRRVSVEEYEVALEQQAS